MKKFLLLLAVTSSLTSFTQSKDEIAIRKVLNDQVIAWNNGDIEKFMRGYWKNDSLMFIGAKGIKWGWQTDKRCRTITQGRLKK